MVEPNDDQTVTAKGRATKEEALIACAKQHMAAVQTSTKPSGPVTQSREEPTRQRLAAGLAIIARTKTTTVMNLDTLKAIVARYCPVFRIHHDDRYMPCSVEFFMENSELWELHDRGHTVIIPQGQVTGARLLEEQLMRPNSRLRLHLNPEARTGAPVSTINDVPIYAKVKAILADDGVTLEALEINYITLYAYNGSYTVIPGLIETGAHDGDIEHISARVSADGRLIGMWYNAHRSRDGEWVPAASVPRLTNGRPVAYVALHGHGTYPSPGTVYRHFFLGNDKTSTTGPLWKPHTVVLLPNVYNNNNDEDGNNIRDATTLPLVDVAPCDIQDGDQVPPLWTMSHCRSRGTSLDSESHVDASIGNSKSTDDEDEHHVSVVSNQRCDWLFYRGQWGTTPAAIQQEWFHTAETPVSRSGLLRVIGHFWPETKSL